MIMLRCGLVISLAVLCRGMQFDALQSSSEERRGSVSDVKLTYVIHVDRAIREESHVKEQLHALGMSPEYIPVVAAERVAAGEFKQMYVQPQGLANSLYKVAPEDRNAIVATFISHIHALQKMSENLKSTEFGLILEDDVIVPEDWAAQVEAAMQGATLGWDVLKLAGTKLASKADPWDAKSKDLIANGLEQARNALPFWTRLDGWTHGSQTFLKLSQPVGAPANRSHSGMGAYLVRSSAIQRILKHLTTIPIQDIESMLTLPSDVWDVYVYEVLPHIFNVTSDAFPAGAESTSAGIAVLPHGNVLVEATSRKQEAMRRHTPLIRTSISEKASMGIHQPDGRPKHMPKMQNAAAAPEHLDEAKSFEHPAWLRECKTIYLDVGSNIGVQVRKLFEPAWYPGSKVLPLFDEHYGAPEMRTLPSNTSGVCALGLEPNPRRWGHLRELEDLYKQKGWNVHFYPYGAWKSEGTLNFDEAVDPAHADWGAHLRADSAASWSVPGNRVSVRTVDLGSFVKSLPAGSVKLMKIDIETAEYTVIPRLIDEKVLCQGTIDMAFIESHPWGSNEQWMTDHTYTALKKVVEGADCDGAKVTEMVDLDDEAYFLDTQDLAGNPLSSVWARIQVIVFALVFLTLASLGGYVYLEKCKTKSDEKSDTSAIIDTAAGGLGM